ncbi:MAG: prepilin-type N-terminal cleavage/methylation domain-containing protein [Candidatus Omnitrophica bacterium]|nr:prepilin-type N-terminal cleavage/methylation domain-containing protein [Candidatus Omnitrophota bacterium]
MKNIRGLRISGVSLLELMIALAIFSLISLSVTSIIGSIQKSWDRQRDTLEVVSNGSWAIEFMTNELRHTDDASITVSPSGDSVRFRIDPDSDGNPPYRTVQYQLTGTVLERRQLPGAYEELANFITSNSIFAWSGEIVTITLTLNKGDVNYTLISQARPRNL